MALRVLIIDDVQEDADHLIRVLAAAGYEPASGIVQTAPGLETALAEQTWDLVLARQSAPGLPAAEALRLVRQRSPGLPFILITDSAPESPLVEMFRAGVDDCLPRTDLSHLARAVDRALKEAAQKRRRLQTELALRESEERFRRLVESCPEGMAIVADGRLAFVNPSGVRLFGAKSPVDLLGRPFLSMVDPNYHDLVEEQLNQAAEGQLPPPIEHRLVRVNGSSVLVETSLCAVPFHGERAIQLLMRDISARKRLETQLASAQKMEAVARLAGGVANDFNNLLTVITGYSGLIRSGLPAEHPLQTDVRQIMLSTERAIGLTAQLLALSRKEAGTLEPLDLNALLEDVAPLARRLAGEKIRCQIEPGPEEAVIKADRGQIETAIVNLCSHARERQPGGGTLRIRVSPVAVTGQPGADHGLPAGAYVLLTLSDAGPSLTDEERTHLFEPFFEHPEAGPKSGLLLATVYAIVRQHGGTIVCESPPNQGCTFRIYLPRLERVAGPRPAARAAAPLPERGVVLVVEDEEVLRDFALLILGRGGFTAIGAADGLEAIELLRRRNEPVDLIFTDVVMPRMGGGEMARQLESICPNTPILFTSGYPKSILAGTLPADRAVEFLQKPYTTQGLLDRVRALLSAGVTG